MSSSEAQAAITLRSNKSNHHFQRWAHLYAEPIRLSEHCIDLYTWRGVDQRALATRGAVWFYIHFLLAPIHKGLTFQSSPTPALKSPHPPSSFLCDWFLYFTMKQTSSMAMTRSDPAILKHPKPVMLMYSHVWSFTPDGHVTLWLLGASQEHAV